MEPEVSLPHSQVTATCLYPEPHRSSPGSSKWSLSLSFPTKTMYTHLFSSIRAACPAHPILLDLITRTILGEEYRSLSSSLHSFLHSPVISSLLDPNILFSTLFSNTLRLRSSLIVGDQVSHPYKTRGKIICGNKMPTRSNRWFLYCRSYCLLNMFRASLCPSSGAQ